LGIYSIFRQTHLVGDEDLFTTEWIQDFEPSENLFSNLWWVDELSHVDLKPKYPATKSEDTEITGQSNTETKTCYFQRAFETT